VKDLSVKSIIHENLVPRLLTCRALPLSQKQTQSKGVAVHELRVNQSASFTFYGNRFFVIVFRRALLSATKI
jgi:hypothetical protein